MKLQEDLYAEQQAYQQPKPTWIPPVMPKPYHQDNEPRAPPTQEAVKRILSDYQEILKSNHPLIHASIDEDDVTHVQALIIGPPETPYEGGFFHFDMIYPSDYPWKPPKVQLITTDNGQVRFNPNLYANGKVCLSILGTWSGPGWTSVQTMLSTLISIQSLMNPAPYHNEPGYESERHSGDVTAYNECITHETLRVAVCGMMERPTFENIEEFQDVMDEYFLKNYESYVKLIVEKAALFDGKNMEDPFGESRGVFNYKALLNRLDAIKIKVEAKRRGEPMEETNTNTNNKRKADQMSPSDPEDKEANQPTAMQVEPTDNKPVENTGQATNAPSTNVVEPVPEHEMKDVEQPQLPPSTGNETSTAASTTEVKSPEQPAQNTQPAATDKPALQDVFKNILADVMKTIPPGTKAADPNSITIPIGNAPLLDLDAQFAAMLQAQFENEAKEAVKPKAVASPGKVKFRDMKSNLNPESDPNYDPNIVCIVCRQSPVDYIVLPNCPQPHYYCLPCATKLSKPEDPQHHPWGMRQRRNNKKKDGPGGSVSCVLCRTVSPLPDQGLAALRQRRVLAKEDPMICPSHNQEVLMFCTAVMQRMCPVCIVADEHKRHNDDQHKALEDAVPDIEKHLKTYTKSMEEKVAKWNQYSENVEQKRPDLVKVGTEVKTALKQKIEEVKKMFDEKLAELEKQVELVQGNKERHLDAEITKAKRKVQSMQTSVSSSQKLLEDKPADVIKYLCQAEKCAEEMRFASLSSDPEVENHWFKMPHVQLNYLEEQIRAIRYRDRPEGYGGVFGVDDEYDYDSGSE